MRKPSGRVAAFTLLALAGAACDGPPSPVSPSTPSTPSTALASRPLRFPAVAAGAACPTTAPRPWSGPGVAEAVLGDGPVYPVADYFGEGTVLELRAQDRRPDGSYVKKVRWIGAGYRGPVLVRAARIDGRGAATSRFAYTGEERDGGYHAELPSATSDLPGTTTVTGPGCYAVQVDGTTFTTVVVFRAA
ncbi:hypothetical protein ACSNOI_38425 [Actinomadura kijaniata]|uniref:hypothetical protein n=1 Tax=Actinomadura kijaniata TaxID=46161 RepID=UPI003F1E3951